MLFNNITVNSYIELLNSVPVNVVKVKESGIDVDKLLEVVISQKDE